MTVINKCGHSNLPYASPLILLVKSRIKRDFIVVYLLSNHGKLLSYLKVSLSYCCGIHDAFNFFVYCSVIAELYIENVPFLLYSEYVKPFRKTGTLQNLNAHKFSTFWRYNGAFVLKIPH